MTGSRQFANPAGEIDLGKGLAERPRRDGKEL